MMRIFAFLAAGLLSTAALADQQQAEQCASGLTPESKVIFDDVAPKVSAGTDLREVVTNATKSLVMSGKVARSTAKESAEAAGTCLVKLTS